MLRVWFALHFDAVTNVDSSNPWRLYEALRKLVEQKDHGHRLIADYRRQLKETVRKSERLSAPEKAFLRNQIKYAPIADYRPQIWRLDLQKIAARRGCSIDDLLAKCRNQAIEAIQYPQQIQPDEYLIEDLQHVGAAVDFEVIGAPVPELFQTHDC
jgi:hypothetical protein